MKESKNIYLIGICGTAMASLAGMLRERDYTGERFGLGCLSADVGFSRASRNSGLQGISTRRTSIQAKPDLVVIGNALSRGNPEVEYVLDSGIRYASMAETVKEFFIRGKNSIVVSGTHGKTTTTAMLAWMLEVAGRKPSFLVGGIAENFGRSFQVADGPDFVIEGDEYDTAFFDKGPKFLHYLPRIVLLKNIEFDHADIYADLEAIKTSFRRLINIVPRSGLDCRRRRQSGRPGTDSRGVLAGVASRDWHRRVSGRASSKLRKTEWLSTWFDPEPPSDAFRYRCWGRSMSRMRWTPLSSPENWTFRTRSIQKALSTFKSVKRRLELRGEVDGVRVYDDFAHHPTAVLETLRAVRQRFGKDRIWAVFEPRSQTCRRRVFEQAFIECVRSRGRDVIANVFGSSKLDPEQTLSPDRVADGIRARGKAAHTFGLHRRDRGFSEFSSTIGRPCRDYVQRRF